LNAKRELALFEKDLVATLKRSWKGEEKTLCGRVCVAGRLYSSQTMNISETHLISHTNEGTVRNRLHSCHHPSDIMRLVPFRIWQLDVF
jgi:predicted class III extradiol MEMO1 family dioxygenase